MIDRILHNTHIYTFDPQNPHAQALAMIGENIVAIGSDDEILSLAGSQTQIDNLNGYFVLPGLVDSHIHWENVAKYRHAVDLWQVSSKSEALRRISAKMDSLHATDWLFGSGWAQDLWEDTERQFPTHLDLDAVTGHFPAYFAAKSGHAAWVNSAALRLGGIDRDTPDPEGGKIGRFPDGSPNGILLEMPAMNLVKRHVPEPTPERLAIMMHQAQQEAWRFGLVGIHDFDNPSCMVALQLLRERGELGLRVVKQINVEWIEHAHELGIRSGFGDDWIRFGGLKLFADGALGARTAAMISAYDDESDNFGVVVTDKETMIELVSRASQLGLASTVHAIGDKAVHDVLDVFELVRGQEEAVGIPRHARRHRIEHVQVIHPDDIGRLGQLGIIASMQPIHMASDYQMADRAWGERARLSYHWRAQLDAGAVLTFGSDAPIDPFDTLRGIYTALTRKDQENMPQGGWYPEARLTMEETLKAYTLGPAYAGGMENRSGRLKRGFLADLIVMNRDPFEIAPEEILEAQLLGTLVGGTWRHRIFE